MSKLRIATAAAVLLTTSSAWAEPAPTVGELRAINLARLSNPAAYAGMLTYLGGLMDGLEAANTTAEQFLGEQRYLFCPPGRLPFNADNALALLMRDRSQDHSPAHIALLGTLHKTFPCKP